jgi:hypothetical protein
MLGKLGVEGEGFLLNEFENLHVFILGLGSWGLGIRGLCVADI